MVVLDSWALLAYLGDEPAAPRIEAAWLEQGAAICSLNLGEVLYIRIRQRGSAPAIADVEAIRSRLQVLEPDWPLTCEAAEIKARGGLAFADAFALATAASLDAPLWTGDLEILTFDTEVPLVDLR